MRPTDYNGQVVDRNTKEALETQFAGEFLRFAPQGNGFVMQAKLPDFGRNEAGEQFCIRRNINYFMRGAANFCLDESGRLDLEKLEGLADTFFPNHPVPPDRDELTKVAELCQIPAEDREDFFRFAEAAENSLGGMAQFLSSDMHMALQTYQYNLEHFDDPEYKQTRQRLLSESYEDYKNTLTAFSEMAHMNVNDENRMMIPLDCRQSALLNQTLLPFVKNYKGLAPENDVGGPVTITMPSNPKGLLGGKENKFAEHYCTSLKADLEGREQVISLETTAPPMGKLLFAPGVERTGVGIYDSTEQLEQYHMDNNLVDVPSMKEFEACKKISWKTMEGVKKCPAPAEMEQEVPVPPRPNAVKRWLNRSFGFFRTEVDAYNNAVSRNDMVRKTKQLSEAARLSKLSGGERKQEQQKARLQRKEGLSRQHARLNRQFTDMKKRSIRNIGYYTQTGDGGLSDLRNIASRAIFINSMEELYTKGSPQVRDLLGKMADSDHQSMEKLYEIWQKSSDHQAIVDYYIDRAQHGPSHTIPLTGYLGREDCQIFTNAQKSKEETYGQREMDAYERFTQKCLEEYDDMKKTVPFKHGEMISDLENMVHTAKQNKVTLDTKTAMKQLSAPEMKMGKH